ncbi:GNAT family N-acetyltransferase [Corynebacterium sp. H130]|uniref:GNAT family N-acetyltransferase n=1 Tax=Corynebacterium sp. H130 TaxID=3133444 RepID=UPI0030980431
MVAPFLGFPEIRVREAHEPSDPIHPGWPECTETVTLAHGGMVRLRPILKSDGSKWRELRLSNQQFLQPVEPTVPNTWESAHSAASWRRTFNYFRREALNGAMIPMAIELDGKFIGQLTLGNIQRGVASECWVGYWIDYTVTGRGIAKVATALGCDFAFTRVGLHRVTATYLPTNPASGAVLTANGFKEEGLLRRNLHIDGSWQDHYLMGLVVDDFAASAVERLRAAGVLV